MQFSLHMINDYLSRSLVPFAFHAGALALFLLSSACTSMETLPGGTGSSGGGPGGAASCAPLTGGAKAPVVPWSHGFEMNISSATTDGDAAMIIGAASRDPKFNLGLGAIGGEETGSDIIAKFSSEGKILWTRRWDGSSVPVVAADACGNVFVARNPAEDPTADPKTVKRSLVIAKLDGEGHDIWQHAFHFEPRIQVTRIFLDDLGDAVMLGSYQGLIELGKDVLSSPTSVTAFIASFSADTGEVLWNMDVDAEGPIGIGLAPGGQIMVAGSFTRAGKICVPVGSASAGSLVVARISAAGAVQSFAYTGASTPFTKVRFAVSSLGDVGAAGRCPAPGSDTGESWCMIRFAASGAPAVQQVIGHEPFIMDSAQITFDVQGNLLMLSDAFNIAAMGPATGDNLYLTRMSPAGAVLRASAWPTTGGIVPVGLEVDPAGGLVIAAAVGTITPSEIDLGSGPITGGIFARIAP